MSARCCSRLCEGISILLRSGRPSPRCMGDIRVWNATNLTSTNSLEPF
jgi:hypothetical protein